MDLVCFSAKYPPQSNHQMKKPSFNSSATCKNKLFNMKHRQNFGKKEGGALIRGEALIRDYTVLHLVFVVWCTWCTSWDVAKGKNEAKSVSCTAELVASMMCPRSISQLKRSNEAFTPIQFDNILYLQRWINQSINESVTQEAAALAVFGWRWDCWGISSSRRRVSFDEFHAESMTPCNRTPSFRNQNRSAFWRSHICKGRCR